MSLRISKGAEMVPLALGVPDAKRRGPDAISRPLLSLAVSAKFSACPLVEPACRNAQPVGAVVGTGQRQGGGLPKRR
jgi:hypothetical protein